MEGYTLYVKNMVCDRCKAAVEHALDELRLKPLSVELGRVVVAAEPDGVLLDKVRSVLARLGFELLEGRQQQTVERIKAAIIELVHYSADRPQVNLSDYLSGRLGMDYSGLSRLFSETTGVTIERYFILQRVERVKELIFYGEMSLGEIALATGYSSVAYLSAQFKSVTGMTPSQFRTLRGDTLKQLDKI